MILLAVASYSVASYWASLAVVGFSANRLRRGPEHKRDRALAMLFVGVYGLAISLVWVVASA